VSFDVVTVGEAMLRLSAGPGTWLETAGRLDLHVAGSEANTAIALAQLGRSVAWVSRLPEGSLGRRVARELQAAGVDTSLVSWAPGARMGLYFVELSTPPRPVSVVYDRADSAAAGMTSDDVPDAIVDSARVVHLSGITPALSPTCRRLTFEVAARARSGAARLTIDVNYRAKLWTPDEARACMADLVPGADLIVVTREDAGDVFGITGEPFDVVTRARTALEVETVVLTLGDQGAVWDAGSGPGQVSALPTTIVDRLGAGDAFMAGVIDGLLEDDIERGLRTGTVLASLALGVRGDHVVTTRQEVEGLIEGRGRTVDR
jgi:2-dehydro-3-deoxygluconokinase